MKKSILINEENKNLINKICLDAHGERATQRLCDFDEIVSAVSRADKFCKEFPKKFLKGLRYGYGLDCQMPKSYKYQYEADFFVIEWTKNGWSLVSV